MRWCDVRATACLPCLKHDLNNIGDDFCPICFVEALSDAPCFQSTGPCKHVFHFHCAKQRLETRWPSARVSFEFRSCPVCKQNMNSPALKQILAPILELETYVQTKALERYRLTSMPAPSSSPSPCSLLLF
jgi:hypothetical protein